MANKGKKELCMDYAAISGVEDEIRDLINQLKVYEVEEKIDKEISDEIIEKLEGIAKKIGDAKILK